MDGVAARAGPIGRAGDHDVVSPGKGLADRFKRSTTHDHRLTQRKAPETLQVVRQVPGHPVAVADDAVARHGGDDGDARNAGHFGPTGRERKFTMRKTPPLSPPIHIRLPFPPPYYPRS